jgi:predicted transcriptional regulator
MTEQRILHIEVASAEAALEEFARTWERVARGDALAPVDALSFESLPQLLSTLTPGRWGLIQALKRQGCTSIDALAAAVGRDLDGVAQDVAVLIDLGIVQKVRDGHLVTVPWDEIDLRVPLAA